MRNSGRLREIHDRIVEFLCVDYDDEGCILMVIVSGIRWGYIYAKDVQLDRLTLPAKSKLLFFFYYMFC